MSQAYQSVVAISLDLHGGLLIRQVHHGSADLFVAAICLRLLRAFFRGRFSARALPGWLIWVVLLPLGMLAADWFNDIIEHRQFVQLDLIPSEFSGSHSSRAHRNLLPDRRAAPRPPAARLNHVNIGGLSGTETKVAPYWRLLSVCVAPFITKAARSSPRSPAAEHPQGTAAADGGRAVQSAVREQMPRTFRPAMHRPGREPDSEHAVEYPGTSAAVLLLLLYDFPDPGKFHRFPCSSPPSDTLDPHSLLFPGMPDRHPRAGCRQRRAIGVPSLLLHSFTRAFWAFS